MRTTPQNDNPASRHRSGSMAILLVVSALAVMLAAVLRGPLSSGWKADAVASDSISARRNAERNNSVPWFKKDTIYPKYDRRSTPKRLLHIELNGADSTELCRVYGIGPVFSRRIVRYRERLGGYADVIQLTEVKGITDEVFEQISANFWVDSAKIRKIGINFATRKQLLSHPYITPAMANRILRGSGMEGGYTTLKELTNSDILLPQEARKLAPYLSFEPAPKGGAHIN